MSDTDFQSTRDPAPVIVTIRLGIALEGNRAFIRELSNLAPEALIFDPETRTLMSDPLRGKIPFPFHFAVEFQAMNFRFRGQIVDALRWEFPRHRPSYIEEPTLGDEDRVISMRVLNADARRNRAQFLLFSEGWTAGNLGIDPTIVNNPDPPP